MRTTFLGYANEGMSFIDELSALSRFAAEIDGTRVLCVNPRGGELPAALLRHRGDLKFDAFVSDDEWRDPAKSFCGNVYFGYSHRALAALAPASYDAVLVCEDMSLVDDEDAMFREYTRLLKPGGMLVGGIWNISYHKYLMNLLMDVPFPADCISDPVHGSCSFPISTLTLRLGGLGFTDLELYSLYGEPMDVGRFVEISRGNGAEPADEALFLTKTFLLKAVRR